MAGKDLQSVSYKYDFSKQEACNLQLEINTKTGAGIVVALHLHNY